MPGKVELKCFDLFSHGTVIFGIVQNVRHYHEEINEDKIPIPKVELVATDALSSTAISRED